MRRGREPLPDDVVSKGESHMSEVFSIDTPDHTVSGPVLAFIEKTLQAHGGLEGVH